ncbi:MAG: hypothetical protein WCP91_02260 [Candidatus Berkelbacteria bacterium]
MTKITPTDFRHVRETTLSDFVPANPAAELIGSQKFDHTAVPETTFEDLMPPENINVPDGAQELPADDAAMEANLDPDVPLEQGGPVIDPLTVPETTFEDLFRPPAELPAPPDLPEPPAREATVPPIDESVTPTAPAMPIVAAELSPAENAIAVNFLEQLRPGDRLKMRNPNEESVKTVQSFVLYDPATRLVTVDVGGMNHRIEVHEFYRTFDTEISKPDADFRSELEEGLDEIAAAEDVPKVNDIHSDEAQLEAAENEELESYQFHDKNGGVDSDNSSVLTIYKDQAWKRGDSPSEKISAIRISANNGKLAIAFGNNPAEEKTTQEWKDDFAGWQLISVGVNNSEVAPLKEIVENSAPAQTTQGLKDRFRQINPSEAAGQQYADGTPNEHQEYNRGRVVAENIPKLPEVSVDGSEAVAVPDAAEAEREKEVVKVEDEIDKVVEQVPAVAAEVVVEENGEADDTDDGKATGKENLPKNAQDAFDQLAGGSQVNMPVDLARQAEEIRFTTGEEQPEDKG